MMNERSFALARRESRFNLLIPDAVDFNPSRRHHRHGPARPGHLSRHVVAEVARTSRAMTNWTRKVALTGRWYKSPPRQKRGGGLWPDRSRSCRPGEQATVPDMAPGHSAAAEGRYA